MRHVTHKKTYISPTIDADPKWILKIAWIDIFTVTQIHNDTHTNTCMQYAKTYESFANASAAYGSNEMCQHSPRILP